MLSQCNQILFGLVPADVTGVAMVIEAVLVQHLGVLIDQQDVAGRI